MNEYYFCKLFDSHFKQKKEIDQVHKKIKLNTEVEIKPNEAIIVIDD